MLFFPAMIFIIESQSIFSADTVKLSEEYVKLSNDVVDHTSKLTIVQNNLDGYQTRASSAPDVQSNAL
jgi:hypothetical protein